MIELNSFTKSYGTVTAVKDISFIAPSRAITGLAGLNGAGKTTILKAVASIHYADSGHILVNGLDAHASPLKNKGQTGFIPEQSSFYPDYTVHEFLHREADIVLFTQTKTFRREQIQSVIEQCALSEVYTKKIKTLSKGYRQRLSVARCLLGNPSVLVLDEPTSGLDPRQIVDMRRLIENLAREKTILISTHLMQEIEALCSCIAVIHHGSLAAFGSEQELCAQTGEHSLEKAFLTLTDNENLGTLDYTIGSNNA